LKQQVKDKPAMPRASFLGTIKAVLWAFFGVRKRGEYEKDVAQLNPVHVILTGLFCAVVLVVLLVVLVNFVVG